ncbi:hypothetical protein C1I12_04290 [Listeria monocytogenes]|uniref:DUF262 domain-containing protein n=1 Tax=Listeria monocytogenes TaxID=1639 RepID=UPI000C869C90|nr:DUF262 domain-containing protein [Listeria monocytogenes]EAK8914870.1 DUF262 domain-containing protein [Listeria monocytogenes]EAK8917231.1 DUF262 domain-containing protein [Listeria monocytogenes]EHH9781109.1 DUF262 domain-containing protein [Listeria monocytogenes]EHH9781422.1 DUF262 domain-containing protein [Listeria monocytogenes]EJL5247938.1 DUF262 domain-containing protein [Listeria monocytogenes]
MGTDTNTFIEIFNTSFDVGGEAVQMKKIVIPIIQRDYAQGRIDPEVNRIRERFLDSLHQAIKVDPITLDFVYGDINEHGIMTPLDGQQRLTALFLLHWYAAKKEDVDITESLFLENFSYETRYSARDFCSFLIKFNPTFTKKLSEEIVDQAWFPLDWKKDPTISSMLVMLDAIQVEFAETQGIWERLKDKAISFYFLPIKDMGLTDELYIKMNSRGKPLTQFEHFKAELERELRKIDEPTSKRVIKKIDLDWTDMLWRYRGDDNVIDDEFLRYFRFICDIICYQNGGTTQGKSNDEFDLLKEYFSAKNENVMANIQTLEKYFDCWCCLQGDNAPDKFLERFISYEHQSGKIKIEKRYGINIFKDCVRNYADISGNGNRQFPLNRIVLLYAVVSYLLNKETISEDEFSRRLRIVNNLIQNSEDEISDSELRTSGNRMPAILKQVDAIIKTGTIDEAIEKNFNPSQLAEEALKITWVENNPDKAEALFELEDHDLLQGQIGIIGLDHPEYFPRFRSLFSCKWDLVDCALVTIGSFGQREKKGRYQLGSKKNTKAWRNLFHKSSNEGFDNTKEVLADLLSRKDSFDDELLSSIINTYIAECETNKNYEWQYYYVKYDLFRPGSFGKYYWENFEKRPYDFCVMSTESKLSENSYQPFLRAVYKNKLSKDHYGQRAIDGDNYVICTNSAYVVKNTATNVEVERIAIAQNDKGIDTEDRILKLQLNLG